MLVRGRSRHHQGHVRIVDLRGPVRPSADADSQRCWPKLLLLGPRHRHDVRRQSRERRGRAVSSTCQDPDPRGSTPAAVAWRAIPCDPEGRDPT